MAVILKQIDKIQSESDGSNSLEWSWKDGAAQPEDGHAIIFGENGVLTSGIVRGRPDGTSETNAGDSAKQILDDGYSTGDGIYWIRGADGQPFEAYCNMTRSGGGWLGVMNLDAQTSGTKHYWNDTNWWLADSTAGSASTFLASDNKAQSWKNFTNFAEIMIMVHKKSSYRSHGTWTLLSAYEPSSMYDLLNIGNTTTGTKISGNRTGQGGNTGHVNNPNRDGNSNWKCEFTDSVGGYELRVNWVHSGSGAKYSSTNDTKSWVRLTTGMGDPNGPSGSGGYSHSFSGLGGYHERPSNDYITNFDFAAYTEYCDTPNSGVMTGNYTGPIRGNDGNVVGCGGWPTPVETTGLDCAIFVR